MKAEVVVGAFFDFPGHQLGAIVLGSFRKV